MADVVYKIKEKYLTVKEASQKWNVAERTVRNYCALEKINGAFLKGKTWNIPFNAEIPDRINKKDDSPKSILETLKFEKDSRVAGGLYHKVQIELTYNSNHIEGSKLSEEQTRYIFETNTIGVAKKTLNVDDIVETSNHFRCIDMIIDGASLNLSENFIKNLHRTLKNGTSDSRKSWFAVGNYKKIPNQVGGKDTTPPEKVADEIKSLLLKYNAKKTKTFEEILDFHVQFEKIHPFQDGNGRVGRLILFKECLKNNIVPFIITDELKFYYYRGIAEWKNEKGFLTDTCLTAQDAFKKYLDYFRVKY